MSTLNELEEQRELQKYDPSFDPDDMPERYIWLIPSSMTKALAHIAAQKKDRGRDLTPIEQVESALHDFCIGRPLSYGKHARNLEPQPNGVWELKTTDVRIFGWFAARSHFIAVCMEMKKFLKSKNLYDPFLGQVRCARDKLELDDPKFLQGAKITDVT